MAVKEVGSERRGWGGEGMGGEAIIVQCNYTCMNGAISSILVLVQHFKLVFLDRVYNRRQPGVEL